MNHGNKLVPFCVLATILTCVYRTPHPMMISDLIG
jgi:hypothetical protein